MHVQHVEIAVSEPLAHLAIDLGAKGQARNRAVVSDRNGRPDGMDEILGGLLLSRGDDGDVVPAPDEFLG